MDDFRQVFADAVASADDGRAIEASQTSVGTPAHQTISAARRGRKAILLTKPNTASPSGNNPVSDGEKRAKSAAQAIKRLPASQSIPAMQGGEDAAVGMQTIECSHPRQSSSRASGREAEQSKQPATGLPLVKSPAKGRQAAKSKQTVNAAPDVNSGEMCFGVTSVRKAKSLARFEVSGESQRRAIRRAQTASRPHDVNSPATGLGAGQTYRENLSSAASAQTNSDGLMPSEDQRVAAIGADGEANISEQPDICSPTVGQIIELWRMRRRWHKAEKSLSLQAQAFCRAWAAGDKDEAGKLWKKAQEGSLDDVSLVLALQPFQNAIESFRPGRAALEKQLVDLAKKLPVWAWAKDVKGFGAMNLAAVVGECGDVGSYKSPAALWKRMGLAVMPDGTRQRKIAGEAAIEHGYKPERRAVAFLLADCLIKTNTEKVGDGRQALYYRKVYLDRKAYEAELNPEKAKIAIDRSANRYLGKRVLKHLYMNWRRIERGRLPVLKIAINPVLCGDDQP